MIIQKMSCDFGRDFVCVCVCVFLFDFASGVENSAWFLVCPVLAVVGLFINLHGLF